MRIAIELGIMHPNSVCTSGVNIMTIGETSLVTKGWKTYCCGDELKPCKKCGKNMWKSLGDQDCGDWEEEQFKCQNCANIIYVELPD